MNKKRIAMFFVALMLIASLAFVPACGNGNGNGDETTDENAFTGDVTEIDYWMFDVGGRINNVFRGVVNNFNESRDDINVNFTIRFPSGGATAYDEALNPALAAGDAPDVIMVDGIMIDAVQRGIIADITDLIENDPEFSLDIFYEHKVLQGMHEDRYYALPFNTDYAGIMVYNRNMFRLAGLDPTKPPTTIAELDEMAEALMIEADEGFSQMGFFPWTWLIKRPLSIVAPFGGMWADEEGNATPTHPGNIAALEWMKSYVDKYGFETINSSAGRIGATMGDDFLRGAVAIDYVYNGQVLGLVQQETGFEWDIARFPTVDGDLSIDPGWGLGWLISITEQSENKEAAFEFLKYYIGVEGMTQIVEQFDEAITLSSIPEVNERFAQDMPRQMQQMIEEIYPNIGPIYSVTRHRNAYQTLQEEAIESVLRGEADPRAALEDVARRYQALLSDED